MAAAMTTIACEASVMISVFWRAVWKFGSDQTSVKLSKPTQFPVREPLMASVKLR